MHSSIFHLINWPFSRYGRQLNEGAGCVEAHLIFLLYVLRLPQALLAVIKMCFSIKTGPKRTYSLSSLQSHSNSPSKAADYFPSLHIGNHLVSKCAFEARIEEKKKEYSRFIALLWWHYCHSARTVFTWCYCSAVIK